MDYKSKKVELYKSRFSVKEAHEKLDGKTVSLWNIAPVWPGRSKSKVGDSQLAKLVRGVYDLSDETAHMVLWMPSSELHKSMFDPMGMCGPWILHATLFSGSDPLHIGFVYARSRSRVDWGTKLILDERGKRGPSSTKAVKFMLDTLVDNGGLVADPFAHRSAALPVWTRRKGLRYVGFTSSKKSYAAIVWALAQEELPGIQLEVPA